MVRVVLSGLAPLVCYIVNILLRVIMTGKRGTVVIEHLVLIHNDFLLMEKMREPLTDDARKNDGRESCSLWGHLVVIVIIGCEERRARLTRLR
jgi:hypothetical protein